MTTSAGSDTSGLTLLDVYKRDLLEALDGRGGKTYKAMLRSLDEFGEGTLAARDESIKVWSDLHIGHANIIRYCDRPFRDVDEMDAALWANWRQGVEPGETLVCVGDIWFGAVVEPRAVPSGHRKLLVLGNHDLTKGGAMRVTQFDEIKALLTVAGDPPLVFTHLPLPNVPDGYVNIHGHTHEKLLPPDSPHINVSVEQIAYRPIGLVRLRKLARAIIAGKAPAGRTTLARVRDAELLKDSDALTHFEKVGRGLAKTRVCEPLPRTSEEVIDAMVAIDPRSGMGSEYPLGGDLASHVAHIQFFQKWVQSSGE